ncbi:MAG: tRNA pseudouridine(38-40) synthase, partial [uncultured Phycisphaerae bacterium]
AADTAIQAHHCLPRHPLPRLAAAAGDGDVQGADARGGGGHPHGAGRAPAGDGGGVRAPGEPVRFVAHGCGRPRQGAGGPLRHAQRADPARGHAPRGERPAAAGRADPRDRAGPGRVRRDPLDGGETVSVLRLEPARPAGVLQRPGVAPVAVPRRAEDGPGGHSLRRHARLRQLRPPGPHARQHRPDRSRLRRELATAEAGHRRRGQRVPVEHGADHGRHAGRGRPRPARARRGAGDDPREGPPRRRADGPAARAVPPVDPDAARAARRGARGRRRTGRAGRRGGCRAARGGRGRGV